MIHYIIEFEIRKIKQSRKRKTCKTFSTSNDDNLITDSLTF